MARVGHVPGGRLGKRRDAFLVHDVAVLNGMRAQAQRGLDGIGVGGVGHYRKLALAGDGEGGAQLLFEEEGMPVAIPVRPHDAAGEVEFDVVNAVLDLLADGLDEAVGPIALAGLAGGEEVSARGGQKIAGGEHPGGRPRRRSRRPASRQRP